jgi:hypothetical protein
VPGISREQRIEEELQERSDTGKSLREIGRELAKEIERVFEAKVNPRSLEKRAGRLTATNVAPDENPTPAPIEAGNTGNKLNAREAVKRVDAIVISSC